MNDSSMSEMSSALSTSLKMDRQAYISALPDELIYAIIGFLRADTFISFSQTCQRFRRISAPEHFDFVQRLLVLEQIPEHGGPPAPVYRNRTNVMNPPWSDEDTWKRMRFACVGCMRLRSYHWFDRRCTTSLHLRKPPPGSIFLNEVVNPDRHRSKSIQRSDQELLETALRNADFQKHKRIAHLGNLGLISEEEEDKANEHVCGSKRFLRRCVECAWADSQRKGGTVTGTIFLGSNECPIVCYGYRGTTGWLRTSEARSYYSNGVLSKHWIALSSRYFTSPTGFGYFSNRAQRFKPFPALKRVYVQRCARCKQWKKMKELDWLSVINHFECDLCTKLKAGQAELEKQLNEQWSGLLSAKIEEVSASITMQQEIVKDYEVCMQPESYQDDKRMKDIRKSCRHAFGVKDLLEHAESMRTAIAIHIDYINAAESRLQELKHQLELIPIEVKKYVENL